MKKKILIFTSLFAVIIAAGVVFFATQKKNSAVMAIFSENMEVLARTEASGSITLEPCFETFFVIITGNSNECESGTKMLEPSEKELSNSYKYSKCIPTKKAHTSSSNWGGCYVNVN